MIFGWSLGLFLDDLCKLYVNDNTSDDVQTSKLPFYKYINWEQKQEALNKQTYWDKAFVQANNKRQTTMNSVSPAIPMITTKPYWPLDSYRA